MDIPALISMTVSALGVVQQYTKQNSEAAQAVLDLQGRLFALQQALLQIQSENDDLRNRMRLRALILRDNLLWDGDDPMPYCPACAALGREARMKWSRSSWTCVLLNNGCRYSVGESGRVASV